MKKIVISTLAFLIISSAMVCFIPVRPVVIVQNTTKERVYLHTTESISGIEPAPEEVDKIMRARPDIIESGEEVKIKGSFSSIIMDGYKLNIGWSVGGEFEYNANGGGGLAFLLSSKSNVCSAKLIIQPGYNNFEIIDRFHGVCLKKLYFMKDESLGDNNSD
ncbi:hypothetical protein [Pantoea allii]|uniref:hypothetical protein n=1 Tax=Pantoea allii TaxID=574096 RepID=UPI0024B6CAAE|nr:hypothetical protein [Pantoea allii]MDJ0087504.1 hypothetical protein [Pantoea allii]